MPSIIIGGENTNVGLRYLDEQARQQELAMRQAELMARLAAMNRSSSGSSSSSYSVGDAGGGGGGTRQVRSSAGGGLPFEALQAQRLEAYHQKQRELIGEQRQDEAYNTAKEDRVRKENMETAGADLEAYEHQYGAIRDAMNKAPNKDALEALVPDYNAAQEGRARAYGDLYKARTKGKALGVNPLEVGSQGIGGADLSQNYERLKQKQEKESDVNRDQYMKTDAYKTSFVDKLGKEVKTMPVHEAEQYVRGRATELSKNGIPVDEAFVQGVLNQHPDYNYVNQIKNEAIGLAPDAAVGLLEQRLRELDAPEIMIDKNGKPVIDPLTQQPRMSTHGNNLFTKFGVKPDTVRNALTQMQRDFSIMPQVAPGGDIGGAAIPNRPGFYSTRGR